MNQTIKFCKVREVKSPCRAHPFDAGIDFFVPTNLTVEDMKEKNPDVGMQSLKYAVDNGFVKTIVLKAGQRVLIPSGIKLNVPDGYMLMYDNKSGISSKRGLLIGAKIVDIGYQGECHLNLFNASNETAEINAGDKICQGILVNIGFQVPVEVENEEALFEGKQSDRGEGGFGSSGTTATA